MIEYIARGGGKYRVLCDGVEYSAHTQYHKALQTGHNLKVENPDAQVFVKSDFMVEILVGTAGGGGGVTVTRPVGADITPDQFSFTDLTNQTISTSVTSNTITVSGLDPSFSQTTYVNQGFDVTPLVSPWYDVTAVALANMPNDSGNKGYYYKWNNNAVVTGGNASRVQFTGQSEFYTGLTLATNISTGHVIYWKASTAPPYEAPTSGGSLYLDVVNGKIALDNRATDGSWNNSASGTTTINDGQSHSISVYVKLNTVGSANGTFKVWVDGNLEINVSTLEFVTASGETINQLLVGPSLDSPTTGVVEMWIDDVSVVSGDPVPLTSSPISISGNGAEYRKNSGAWTTAAGTVVNGDTIQLRQTTSGSYSTQTATTLTIGGVSDTWSVTTQATPPSGGDPYGAYTQYYVNQSHANAADAPGNGSEANPWKTVRYAYAQLVAGDCLNVVNGTNSGVEDYTETVDTGQIHNPCIRATRSGTSDSNRIVIRALPGQERMVRVQSPGQVFGNANNHANPQSWLTYDGLVVHSTTVINGSSAANSAAGCFAFTGSGTEGIKVLNCDLQGGGIVSPSDNCQIVWLHTVGTQTNPITFYNCRFRDHRRSNFDHSGPAAIHSYGGSTYVVYQCHIENVGMAVGFKGGGAGAGSAIYRNYMSTTSGGIKLPYAGGGSPTVPDLQIYQNIFDGAGPHGEIESNAFCFLNESGSVSSLKIYNNTLYNTSRVFFKTNDVGTIDAGAIEYYNNIRVKLGSWDVTNYETTAFENWVGYADYNCVGTSAWTINGTGGGSWSGFDTNAVTADPQLQDPANGDFQLETSSPCINAGLDRAQLLGGLATDQINMGAYVLADQSDQIGADWLTVADPVVERGFTTLHTLTANFDQRGWSGTPLCTDDSGNLYYAFKLSASLFEVGKVRASGAVERIEITPRWQRNDDHDMLSIGIDRNGYLHVFGPNHQDELDYYVSNAQNSVTGGFTRQTRDVNNKYRGLHAGGQDADWRAYHHLSCVTYAAITYNTSGDMYVGFRFRVNNNGYYTGAHGQQLAKYNSTTEEWEQVGGNTNPDYSPHFSGPTFPNPKIPCLIWSTESANNSQTGGDGAGGYVRWGDKTQVDFNGRLHLAQPTFDGTAGANPGGWSDSIVYAYSDDDGVTWKAADGTTLVGNPIIVPGGSDGKPAQPAALHVEREVGANAFQHCSGHINAAGQAVVKYYDRRVGTRIAVWNGSTWVKSTVAVGGGITPPMAVDSNNVWYLFGGRYIYVSANDGASWKTYDSGISGNSYPAQWDVRYFMKTGKIRCVITDYTFGGTKPLTIAEFISDEWAP